MFAAKYLEKRVGLSLEEAAKIVTEHGCWCLYEAQRSLGGGVREAARKNEKIMALVDACSAVSGPLCISRSAWSFIEEKLLDAKVTIELLLASAKDVMDVFGPDELEELSSACLGLV